MVDTQIVAPHFRDQDLRFLPTYFMYSTLHLENPNYILECHLSVVGTFNWPLKTWDLGVSFEIQL